ncbi:MAG: hypothetical protein ACOYMF_10155 [Bacteroidales bacterium]
MKNQVFYKLLTVARKYLGQPDNARLYYDQSIIALRIHTKSDDNIGGYTLIAPSVTTLAAESVFRLTIPCC